MATQSQTSIANQLFYENSHTAEYDNDQSNKNIITPTSSKQIAVKGVFVGTEATSGFLRLEFGTSGNTICTVFANAQPGYIPLNVKGATNEAVRMDSSFGADKNFFILVNYTEK